jgi:predicted PurR-regulated permease PerM
MSLPPGSTVPEWWRNLRLRDVARGTVVVLLVAAAFALGLAIRNVLAAVAFGLLLATALEPVMHRLRFGVAPRFLAASVAVGLLVLLAIGSAVLIVPLIVEQANTLTTRLPEIYGAIRQQLLDSPYRILRQLGTGMRSPAGASVPPLDELFAEGAAWLPTIGNALFFIVSTLLFTYYWLLYSERTISGLLLLLPAERRAPARVLWEQIEERVGAFVRGQAILGLTVAICSLMAYWLIGVPYPLLLALVAGLLEIVPFIGPIITAALATALGFSVAPGLGLAALAAGVVIQQLESILLAPRIMDKAVGVTPVVSLLAFVGFSALIGPVGGLLAIPLAAAGQVLFGAWVSYRAAQSVSEQVQGRGRVDRLRYEAAALAADMAGRLRQPTDAAMNLSNDSEEALAAVVAELQALLGAAEEGER